MNKTALGVFFIALASLLLELVLIRVFDVLWYPNMAYMVITLAVFSFGLAGVYLSIFPLDKNEKSWRWLTIASILMAVSALLLIPILNRFHFDYEQLANPETVFRMGRNFFIIYGFISIPFFLTGFVLSTVFMHYASQIRKLYFWDLLGAALGCLLLIPLLPKLGTVGIIVMVAALACLAAAFLSKQKILSAMAIAIAIVIVVVPFTWDSIKTFEPHMNKRGFIRLNTVDDGKRNEGTWWDPISKVDILNYEGLDDKAFTFKWIAYDGGTQTSYFYRFDGDYEKLRKELPQNATNHFWDSYLAVSHYAKADSDAEVLVIGSAGGQEIKAALTYGAKHVDAVELVGKVVELGKTTYDEYIGGVMNHPNVNARKGEGRSYLRSTDKEYDIIQINSNHTSSSIAAGSGAMQAAYLQTVEAYEEYFTHLKSDGVLHINHHIYPKMVLTAAKAWKKMGRDNFRQHVLLFERSGHTDNLPTFLIKMTPWTEEEVDKIKIYMRSFNFRANPFNNNEEFLTQAFYSGDDLPKEVLAKIPYRIEAPTDNKPFFNSLRNTFKTLPKEDTSVFVNSSVSGLLNSQKDKGFPVDVIHLIVTATSALVFAILFTIIPLLFAKTGREKWEGKSNFLVYFSCLGLGFIVFELVFIQIFMKLIGYPLYAYTTVLFTFLFGAGVGSHFSERLKLIEKGRIWLPYVGIAITTILLVVYQQVLFDLFLQFGIVVRVLISIMMIFPLAFFLGMPFPLGVLAIQHKPAGTVAWAWAFNGLFTVAGGIFAAIFSVYFGFQVTMLVALSAYVLAYFMYRKLFALYQQDIQQ